MVAIVIKYGMILDLENLERVARNEKATMRVALLLYY